MFDRDKNSSLGQSLNANAELSQTSETQQPVTSKCSHAIVPSLITAQNLLFCDEELSLAEDDSIKSATVKIPTLVDLSCPEELFFPDQNPHTDRQCSEDPVPEVFFSDDAWVSQDSFNLEIPAELTVKRTLPYAYQFTSIIDETDLPAAQYDQELSIDEQKGLLDLIAEPVYDSSANQVDIHSGITVAIQNVGDIEQLHVSVKDIPEEPPELFSKSMLDDADRQFEHDYILNSDQPSLTTMDVAQLHRLVNPLINSMPIAEQDESLQSSYHFREITILDNETRVTAINSKKRKRSSNTNLTQQNSMQQSTARYLTRSVTAKDIAENSIIDDELVANLVVLRNPACAGQICLDDRDFDSIINRINMKCNTFTTNHAAQDKLVMSPDVSNHAEPAEEKQVPQQPSMMNKYLTRMRYVKPRITAVVSSSNVHTEIANSENQNELSIAETPPAAISTTIEVSVLPMLVPMNVETQSNYLAYNDLDSPTDGNITPITAESISSASDSNDTIPNESQSDSPTPTLASEPLDKDYTSTEKMDLHDVATPANEKLNNVEPTPSLPNIRPVRNPSLFFAKMNSPSVIILKKTNNEDENADVDILDIDEATPAKRQKI